MYSCIRKRPIFWREGYFTYDVICLEKIPACLEEHDLSLEFTFHEVFIWETVDKEDLLEVPEYDKEEYDFLLEFILHEECLFLKHIDKRIDKTHLLVTSKNNIEFLTNALPWTPFELAKQYLTLLLETVKFLGKDILTDVEI